ncbi:MAG: hypothetical protein PHG25_03820 [Candidatus Pacebacteria bacterium]|nr:hypothetical protein [Candidatus Paceibacterota bacterium]
MSTIQIIAIGLCALVFVIVLVKLYRKNSQKQLSKAEAERAETQAILERIKLEDQARRIRKFPIREMSATEFDQLVREKPVDLKTCPLGTWFVCTPFELTPDVTVVGQVVTGLEMIANQWGAGMSVPERGVNRYRVKLI